MMLVAALFILALVPQSATPASPTASGSASPASAVPSAPGPVPAASPTTKHGPAASPAATGTPIAENPAVTARAKEWLHRTQTGNIDRTQFDAQMNAALTDAKIKQAAAQLAPLGDPTEFAFEKGMKVGVYTVYIYRVTVPTGIFYWWFGLDADHKIAGMYLRATPPP